MSRNPVRLLVLSVLILAVFSFPQMIPRAHAATGLVCIAPDLPGQTACPAAGLALTGPVTMGPSTLIRVQVFIQSTDPMNGFDVTLLAPHAFLLPVGIDTTGNILPGGTVLLECLQNVLVAGSVCQPSDTLDTLHFAEAGAPGFITGTAASGLLFTAIYQIVGSAPAGTVIGFQNNANDGQTNCTNTSVPGTCISISNGTITPPSETDQTATFSSATTQPSIQISPNGGNLGTFFHTQPIPAQTVTATDTNGYAATVQTDATITYTISVSGPTTSSTGVSATITPTTFDFNVAPGPNAASLAITATSTATVGTWTVSVTGLYHFDPTCAGVPGTCTGVESTLVETVTYTFTLVDFGFTASPTTVPFWCPATAQSPAAGASCPAGQSGSSVLTVTPQGFTGTVTISTGTITPVTTPPLAVAFSATSISGASGISTATFSAGVLRPAVSGTGGAYIVSVRAQGTVGTFTRTVTLSISVRPQNFNVTTSNGTPTGPSISFASGASATDLLTIGSLPSGALAAVNNAAFAGPVTLSSQVTGGSGLTVAFATNPVSLTAGLKLTDLVTFSGTVTSTTTFTATITGSAGPVTTSTPTTQTHTVTYSVTIMGAAKDATSTSIACSPGSINPGQTSTCTATVTDTTTPTSIPSGTATFTLNAGTTGGSLSATSCTLDATGKCAVNFQSATAGGTATVGASYGGDTTHNPSASATSASITVNVPIHPTSTSISCSAAIVVNELDTCTATVTDNNANPTTPTGTVSFAETGLSAGSFSGSPCSLVASATLGEATCSVTFSSTATGGANVVATYSGDSTHSVSDNSASPFVILVAVRSVSVTVSCTPASIATGQTSQCTATVSDTSTGAPTSFATDTVTFGSSDLSATFSPNPCTISGTTATVTCVATYTPSAGGTAMITAHYDGSATHAAVLSSGFSLTVTAAVTITTSLSQTTIAVGGSVTDSATLSGNTAAAGGTVTYKFFSGSSCSGTGSIVGSPVTVTSGVVPNSASQAFNTAGSFSWNAAYSGDINNNAATSACEPLTVNQAVVTVTTSLSPSFIVVGGSMVDSATLSGNTATAGGTVTYNVFRTSGSCSGTPDTTSVVTVANGVAPSSASETFTVVSPASWNAVYSGDSNNLGATSTCEPFTIQRATTTISTTLSATTISAGGSVSDSATLTGGFQAGGTVTYSFFTGSTCGGTGTFVGSPVAVTGGIVPGSASQTFPSAGSFSWNAAYSGDTNNIGATSACEPLTVNPAGGAVLSTTLSATSITVGSSVTDSATLTGVTANAGGTVTYNFFSGSACTGTATAVGSPVTVTAGVVPNSASQAFSNAGSFSWNAVYSGDANNGGTTSGCEPLVVNKASPTVATSLASSSITVGGSVTDSATLTGGFQAGGTVTYNFFTGSTCGGTATPVGTPVSVTSGIVPNSVAQAFNSAGAFSWNAFYNGDSNNNGASSPCEPLTVSMASPTIATTLSATSINQGSSVTDSATLSSGFNAGGTVTYSFFTGSTCTGTGTQVGSPVAVSGGVVPNSASQSFASPGSFSWNAVYSGDANNNGATSSCEPLTVNAVSVVTITTSLSSSSITVGGSVSDSATLAQVTSTAGGTVTYSFFTGSTCAGTGAVVGSSVSVTNGVVLNSASQTFSSAGSFSWNAVYSGDANNAGATSGCEPLTVNQASPTISTTLSANPITQNGMVADSAILTGSFQAGGTVTYSFFSGSTCSGTGTVVGGPVTVTNSVVPVSASQTFPNSGLFSFQASYSGDANNMAATSNCEPLTVNSVVPVTIATTLSATSITVGGSVFDSATLAGVTTNAGGTVTYVLSFGSTCGTGRVVGNPVTVTNGIVPNSDPFTFTVAGPMSWSAMYSGDANNPSAASPCEPMTVNLASPSISTTLSSSQITAGQSVTDSAVLTNSFQAGGTVSYNLFTTADCTGTSTTVSTVPVTSSVVPDSASQTFSTPGSFSWNAVYSGDGNNMGATSACEPLTVSPVTGAPILLSFQAFNFTSFHNGIGPFTVLVNGHVVVVFPGHAFVSSSSTTAFGTDKWVSLGPYDITAFVATGQNNVTFVNTFGIRFSLIRNIMVAQGDAVFLNFKGPRFVSSGHPLTLTFSNPPLVITSFTVTGSLVTDGNATFTATYTGGTGPFKCLFFFGDDDAAFVAGGATSCSVTHDFDDSGNFTARVVVIGSSTSDVKLASLPVTVTESTQSQQLSLGIATISSAIDSDDN